ncbi:beta-1,4-glucuronyltransferase 1 [Anabrus simplex]|uniref:beta-1,4-glucuronyltransferase 1 n=1 Tax=Anabrus simplex TaxID=316456 RepID=UPI0035A326D3
MRFVVMRCARLKFLLSLIVVLTFYTLYRELFGSYGSTNYVTNSLRGKSSNNSPSTDKYLSPPSFPILPNRTNFIPGLFLKNTIPRNRSYCHFNYGMPEVFNWTRHTMATPELGEASPYRVIYSVIEERYSNPVGTYKGLGITYCTHATPEFLYHIVEIVRRWDGPVSVAVYAPGTDAGLSLSTLYHMCHCLPEMAHVSVHLIFPTANPPLFTSVLYFHHHSYNKSKLQQHLFFVNCSAPINLLNGRYETFRHQKGLLYPVNVGRNVARYGAKTSHVLVSDVELLPSYGLVPAFLSMLARFRKQSDAHPSSVFSWDSYLNNYVYVLPVFEIEASISKIPRTKSELLELYSHSHAVYFHRWVCLHCQRFPGLQRWLQKKPLTTDDGTPVIQPLLVVRREFPYHRWEPVYIGTNREPLYSEQLSWEGQQDKMTQMNEMCLMRYRFIILDGAFLVHTPGMKHRTDVDTNHIAWRRPYERQNIKLYENIVRDMMQKYQGQNRCKTHLQF